MDISLQGKGPLLSLVFACEEEKVWKKAAFSPVGPDKGKENYCNQELKPLAAKKVIR